MTSPEEIIPADFTAAWPDELVAATKAYKSMATRWRNASRLIMDRGLGEVQSHGSRLHWPDIVIGKFQEVMPEPREGDLIASYIVSGLRSQRGERSMSFQVYEQKTGPYGDIVKTVGGDGRNVTNDAIILGSPETMVGAISRRLYSLRWRPNNTADLQTAMVSATERGTAMLGHALGAMSLAEYNPELTDLAADLAEVTGIELPARGPA